MSPMISSEYLFVGTHGNVAALDKRDGSTRWVTSLPKTGYQVATMLYEDGVLLCGSGGRVFALDPLDGSILWSNDLPRLGSGVVALATARQAIDPAPPAQQQANDDAAASSATT